MQAEGMRRKKNGGKKSLHPPLNPRHRCAMFAFKEWTLICDALSGGQQSLILRKGGIAEGRAGFRFAHTDFLLFPTLFHEQASKLKLPPDTTLPAPRTDGRHALTLASHVEWTADLTDWDTVCALAPFHLWTETEIRKRFDQDGQPGVSLAFVRVAHLSAPHLFPDARQYGGCRSWVEVPRLPPGTTLEPVLDDATHALRQQAIQAVVAETVK
jgi:hypothetical protein